MIDEELSLLCRRFNIPFLDSLSPFRFVREKYPLIPYALAKKHLLLPVDEEAGILILAITDPLNLEGIEEVRCITGKGTREICVPAPLMEKAIERCYHQGENVASGLIAALKELPPSQQTLQEGYDLLEHTSDSPVICLLNALLTEAIQQGASDIHFEPLDEGLGVRYRIDGVLQLRHSPPREFQTQLIARIKVMAQLDIAETRLPQDGRIKLRIGGREIDFRVSTIPVAYGERVVLRILDKSNLVLGLSKLGMEERMLEEFQKIIHQTEGIILVTGPTGSGKTTTLYSVLSEINSKEVNIMTIEDPIEYKLQGMAQIGVNPKIQLDFATGLRHILRQDPDVIMIGEIRDPETATIAIQASLTGHRVYSTLHTNDAPSALTRLVDMGVPPYLLTSSVLGVVAQRLVRTICPHCQISYEPAEAELRDLGIESPISLFKGEGCSHCFQSGYKGRRGIYELMPLSPSLKKQLLLSADAVELRRIASLSPWGTLRSSGAHLAAEGITTSAEVLRIVGRL